MQRQEPHNGEYGVSPPTSPRHGGSAYSVSRIIDISAIELEKENIQPIRQGRSAQVLSRIFTTQHDDRVQELAQEHERFQSELLKADENRDAMDIYMRYVSWTIENYPQGGAQGHESRLVSILEQAIEKFKDDERYRNDPRFVKLFVLYSEKVEIPLDVFNFMETNRIGSEISMYYEEFADYLESREEYAKARDIFLLGIHRRARPLGRLKRLFEEFEKRADFYVQEQERKAIEDLESTQSRQQQPRSSGSSIPHQPNPTRRVLGDKISGHESRHANETTMGHVPVGLSSSSSRTSSSSSHQRPNARLEIFSDQSAQTSSNRRLQPKIDSSMQENTPWRELGADQIRRKENTREATSWKGAKLMTEDAPLRPPPQPRLQIWRDKDNTQSEILDTREKSEERVVHPVTKSNSTQSHTEATSVKEMHQSTPREHPRNTNQSDSVGEWSQRFPVMNGERGGKERLMIDLKQIYVDREEFSIEEIRSKRMRYSYSKVNKEPINSLNSKQRAADNSRLSSSSFTSNNDFISKQHNQPIPKIPPKQSYNNHYNGDPISIPVKPVLPMDLSDDEENEKDNFGTRRQITASSPTLHTKYASAEMNKIFSDRSRSRKSLDSQWSNDDNKDLEGDELDRFTMAYSIPGIPWEFHSSSREYLDNEIQDEFGDDEEDQNGGRTEGFVRKLEKGFASTITQDIEALKRKHAAESESTRTSFGSNKRSSSRFDPSRRQSDISSSNLD